MIQKQEDTNYCSIDEVYTKVTEDVVDAVNSNQAGLYLITAQTAVGKTSAYCNIVEEDTSRRYLIAVPTNMLKRQVYSKLKFYADVYATPSYDEIGLPKYITDLIQYEYSRGYMGAASRIIRQFKKENRSKEHPYMIADVDRLIVGEDAGLECKTASAFNADQWKDGAVPRHYLLQCYHYMAVTGKRNWYIAVVVLGQGFQYAKLEWDEKVISDLIAVEGDFWFNHVIPNAMPAADGSNATDQVLDQLYGSKTMPAVIRLDGFEKRLARRNEIGEQLKLLEQEQKQIDQEVKMYMGSHETAICEGFKVSWQSVISSRLDTKRIKVEQPELYQEYLTESTSRKFTVKAA